MALTSPKGARNACRLAAFATVAWLLSSCSQPAPDPPPAPPLPADMSGFDATIVERIENEVAGLRRDPRDAGRWRELGMIYQAHQQFDLAARCYRQSSELVSEEPRTHFYLALVDQRLGRLDESIAGLRRVTELEASFAPAFWRLGLALLEKGEPAAARQAVERAVALAPEDAAAMLALARVHLQSSAPEAAARLLEDHLEAHPDDRYAHFLLGGAYRRLERGEDAARHLALGQGAEPVWRDPWSEELEERRAGFGAALTAATELLSTETARAVAELERLRGRESENVTVLINLGIGYRRLQRLEDSAETLREAVRREPSRGLAHFHLAVTTTELAHQDADAALLAQALEHAARAVELQPTSTKGHALLGEILAQSGRTEEAVASYRLAIRDPQDLAWVHRLGALLCELQRWQEAIPVLQGFLERQGDDAEALYLLGAAQANSGEVDDAVATLQRATRLAPQDPKIRQALDQLDQARQQGAER